MLALVTILALAGQAPGASPPAGAASGAGFVVEEATAEALHLATAETTERIALPTAAASSVRVEVLPLERRILLHVPAGAVATLAARIASQAGAICPNVRTEQSTVELRCRTPRIDASLGRDKTGVFLDVNELRGLPWRPGVDGPPLLTYERLVLAGESCPGKAHAARGECALAAGKWVEAARHFRRALGGRDAVLAQLRLGDLAMLAADPATAIGWYTQAKLGPFARVSMSRLCELSASCYVSRPTLDPDPNDLAEPLVVDLTLRHARVEAFIGNHGAAMDTIAAAFERDPRKAICRGNGERLCRRLVLAALRDTSADDAQAALEVFLALPDRRKGQLAVALHGAAAESAAKLGAPVFGGNLLASVAGLVPDRELEAHLLRTAELYLEGQDGARARVVVDFALSRMGGLKGTRWASIRHALTTVERKAAMPVTSEEPAADADPKDAAELAAALAASADAHKLLDELGAKKQGPTANAAPAKAPQGGH